MLVDVWTHDVLLSATVRTRGYAWSLLGVLCPALDGRVLAMIVKDCRGRTHIDELVFEAWM